MVTKSLKLYTHVCVIQADLKSKPQKLRINRYAANTAIHWSYSQESTKTKTWCTEKTYL